MVWRTKEGIFNTEFMGEVEGEKIGAMRVAARGAMRTKNCLEFFTVLWSDVGIDVSTNDEVGVFWDFLENQLKVSRNCSWGASWHG